jgi:hypothetical protein
MPTVLRQEGFEVRINTNDHNPPHVHVYKAGGVCKIALGGDDEPPSLVLVSRNITRSDARMAISIVEKYQQYLLERWSEIYG